LFPWQYEVQWGRLAFEHWLVQEGGVFTHDGHCD
jgi:hypothetical protein